MKNTIRFTGLDCPVCANKLERELQKKTKAKEIQINFLAGKLSYECDDDKSAEVLKEIIEITRKKEKDVKYIL